MSLFDILLVGHLVGDFLFQTKWMAEGKRKGSWPLVVHGLVYTLTVYLFSFLLMPLELWELAFLWISHVIIDMRTITNLWLQYVMGVSLTQKENYLLIFSVDQIVHILVLVVIIKY